MSPDDRRTRTSRTILAFTAAFAVMACTGKAPPSVAPSHTPATTTGSGPIGSATQPMAESDDAALVTGRTGAEGLELILASTGERILTLPVGVPEHDWSHLVSTDTTGSSTTVRDLRLPEYESSSQTIDGTWRYGSEGAMRDNWDLTWVGSDIPADVAAAFDDPAPFVARP